MISKLFLIVLLLLPALPLYAGHGTIRETDTQIFVEYYGDDNEIQAGRAIKEEDDKKAENELKAKGKIQNHKKQNLEMKAARKAERHKDDE